MRINVCLLARAALILILSNVTLGSCGPTQYTLTTSVIPEGAGTISPASGIYNDMTAVTLTTIAATEYRFDYLSGKATRMYVVNKSGTF